MVAASELVLDLLFLDLFLNEAKLCYKFVEPLNFLVITLVIFELLVENK